MGSDSPTLLSNLLEAEVSTLLGAFGEHSVNVNVCAGWVQMSVAEEVDEMRKGTEG
jgi:hypothetical protein